MMKPKKVFKITCFYCHKVFEYKTDFTFMMKRAYCYRDGCEKQHRYDRWRDEKARLEEYKQYLQEVRIQLGYNKGANIILLQIKDGQLFKGEISLGRIIDRDKLFIYVQKYPVGSVCLYRKEFVKS